MKHFFLLDWGLGNENLSEKSKIFFSNKDSVILVTNNKLKT